MLSSFVPQSNLELFAAIRTKDLNKVSFIATRSKIINQINKDGNTPLILAISTKQYDIVAVLIKSGADVNQSLCDGTSPLMVAVDINSLPIATLLIESGADLNHIRGSDQMTSIMIASVSNKIHMLNLLLKRKALIDVEIKKNKKTALILAAEKGDYSSCELLIKSGANINHLSYYGTALAVATANQYEVIVKFLLHNKANPNIATTKGVTPLHHACVQSNPNLIKILLEHGADPNHYESESQPPLLVAISNPFLRNHNFYPIKLMLTYTKDPQQLVTLKLSDILHSIPVLLTKMRFEKLLQKEMGSLPLSSYYQVSYLHLAILLGNERLVAELIECKIDINQKLLDKTPIQLAQMLNAPRMVFLLKLAEYDDTSLPFGHGWLIERVEKQKLAIDKQGMCFGIANMVISAILLNQRSVFNQRFYQMYKAPLSEFDNLQNLEFKIFSQNISLYQDPKAYWKITNAFFQDQQKISELIQPVELEQLGGRSTLPAFTGVYSIQELFILFDSLKKTLEKANIDYVPAFLLQNYNHSIVVGFNPTTNKWIYADSFKLPIIEIDHNDIAFFVANSFCSYTHLIMSTTPIITKHKEIDFKHIIEEWKKSLAWQHLHQITERKAKYIDPHKCTWLTLCALYENREQVKKLIAAHADVNNFTQRGLSPLALAVSANNMDVVEELLLYIKNINHYSLNHPLLLAAQSGYTDIVIRLLQAKADANIKGQNGMTPLLLATLYNHVKIVEILLARGADPNLPNNYKQTPLHYACEFGHTDLVKLLLDNGADPSMRYNERDDAIFLASKKKRDGIMMIFLDNGLDPNTCIMDNKPLIYTYVFTGQFKMTRELILRGAEINFSENQYFNLSTDFILKRIPNPSLREKLTYQIKRINNNKLPSNPRINLLAAAMMYGFNDITKLLVESNFDLKISFCGVSIYELAEMINNPEINSYIYKNYKMKFEPGSELISLFNQKKSNEYALESKASTNTLSNNHQ